MFYGSYINKPNGKELGLIFDFKGIECNVFCLKNSEMMMVVVTSVENNEEYEEHFEVLSKTRERVNQTIILPDCFTETLDENGVVIMGVGDSVQITKYQDCEEFEFSSISDREIIAKLDKLL